jgi:hypothetical protein
MIAKRFVLLAIGLVVLALGLSIASFAQNNTTSTISITAGGIGGELGFVVSQGAAGADMNWTADDATTVTVDAVSNIAVGDFIGIESDGDGYADCTASTCSFHTVTAINSLILTVSPDITNTYSATADVNEMAKNATGATWTPVLNSNATVTAGNLFNVNLTPSDTTDTFMVEIFLTNVDELAKNYTYLNRVVNVYVVCTDPDGADACAATGPFSAAADSGEFEQAEDTTGTNIGTTPDYLTFTNARQSFLLAGGYMYSITLDGGIMYTIDTTTGAGDSLSPTDLVQITGPF